MNNRSLIALLPLLAAAHLTHAEENLAPVVVTATRTAQSADETLAAVTVVSREEIERSQAQSLVELLAGLPGIDIITNGGAGKHASILLRGTNAGHTLFLIDGMQIGSATLGSASPQYLPLAQIERIEIVRGPQSALYGSDAIGGVIQIFTRKGSKQTRANASIGAGQLNTRQYEAGLSASLGKLSYAAQLSRLTTDNIDVLNAPADSDGYRNTAGSFNAAYRINNTAGVEANLLRANGINEYDSNWDANAQLESRFLQRSGNVRLYFKPTGSVQTSLRSGESRDYATEFRNGVEGDRFNTRRVSHSLQNDITLGSRDLFTLGIDHQNDQIVSSVSYDETTRSNTALFMQNQWQGAQHNLSLGARRDDNEAFGVHTTGQLAWGYRFADDLRLSASHGTGFKAPTFNDLYYQDPWGSNGNPELQPEESRSSELALQQHFAGSHWQLRTFRTHITNLIQWVEVAPWLWQPNNVGNARIDGIELEGGLHSRAWRLNGSLTLQEPRDTDTNTYLQRRARQSVRLNLDRLGGSFSWGSSLRLEGDRYDDSANTVLLRGYTLANLHAAYQLNGALALRAKVDNLFDENYTNVAGFDMPGRVGFVSLHYQTE